MYTVIESPVFTSQVGNILTDDERDALAVFLAEHPFAGVVVPGSGGVRKLRWSRRRRGKRGGARVIYFNRLANGEVWLLTIFAKGDRSTIPAHELRLIRRMIENGSQEQDVD